MAKLYHVCMILFLLSLTGNTLGQGKYSSCGGFSNYYNTGTDFQQVLLCICCMYVNINGMMLISNVTTFMSGGTIETTNQWSDCDFLCPMAGN